ncbi:MAG: AAA family ATPase, partial [Xanthomonadales bacterium]|nr:AAA family ATPase [Xanthomonadales bacterium]
MDSVYLQYFGLSEPPFSITPDPSFVYLSQRHRDALAHLMYGVGQGGSGGFVQLTGEVGTGKTTLCRCVLEQVPDDTRIALILNPMVTGRELLAAICAELGLPAEPEDSSARLVERLHAFLLAAHAKDARVVVVIDEAQNLSPEALEQVRLLTNLETSKDKLLQIVLLGQPELRDLLQRQSLRQLAQRITARFHLAPLNRQDTEQYVAHRLQVAGAKRNLFKPGALKALFQRSGGVPRLINIIADRALVAAYARERTEVDAALVHAAADEVQHGESEVRPQGRGRWLAVAVLLLLGLGAAWLWQGGGEFPEPAAQATVQPVTPAGGGQAAEPPEPVADRVPESAASLDRAPSLRPGPDSEWLARQHDAIWVALAELWGAPGDAALIQAACQGQRDTGYACIREQGSWALVRRLGLPVALELQGDRPRLLLLRGVSGGEVLVGADEPRAMPREAIEALWLGQFTV